MRVVVTGANGRLGRSLVAGFGDAPYVGPSGPIAWDRDAFDLDAPAGVGARLDSDRPEVVVHAAAWTDVDGCAREPDLALARNGTATGVLATACAERGIDLIVVSTNEVFDGRRLDGYGYTPHDEPNPINPYGTSKLAGEHAATEAYERAAGRGRLAIVRTAWLFGSGKPDFPMRILAAATRAADNGEPLRVVGDEWGSPTYTADLADGIIELLAEPHVGGIHHVVNGLFATRADWARYVVARAELDVDVVDVPARSWKRDSTAPRWGVLEPSPLPSGEPLRDWPLAMADYAPALLREAGVEARGTRGARGARR